MLHCLLINLLSINKIIKRNKPGGFAMESDYNNYNAPERQATDRREVVDRRVVADRRDTTRFSDELGRRSGVNRRLPMKMVAN